MLCIACSGTGQASKGGPCKGCQGTGQGNAVVIERVTDLVPLTSQASYTVQAFANLPCETPDDFQRCGEGLKALKAASKSIDERRKKITKPLDDAKREVMALFKPILDLYGQAEAAVKRKLADYQIKQEQQRHALLAQVSSASISLGFTI